MKREKRAKMKIVKNLLDVLDDETISKKIGISIREVKELRDKQK